MSRACTWQASDSACVLVRFGVAPPVAPARVKGKLCPRSRTAPQVSAGERRERISFCTDNGLAGKLTLGYMPRLPPRHHMPTGTQSCQDCETLSNFVRRGGGKLQEASSK